VTDDGVMDESTLAIRCSHRALAPTVAIRVWLEGGQSSESWPGQALVTGRMLVEGTHGRSWDRIASESEARGMDIVAFGGSEAIGLSVDALAADWRQALEWAAELTLDTSFPPDRCDWVRRQMAGELESLAEQPEVVAGWAFLDHLYSPHPWSRPPQGSAESLAALTDERIVDFHRQSLGRRLIVSLVGDVDAHQAEAEVRRLFDRPVTRAPSAGSAATPSPGAEPVRRVAVPNSDQAHLYMGQLTVPVTHPDRVALQVAAVVLGAGPGLVGRIPERVSEAEGLAYVTQVATAAGAGRTAGRMMVYVGTAADNVDRARRAVVEELDCFVADGVSEQELKTARQYLLGSAPFRRETAGQVAALQAQSCLYDQPFDRESWLADRIREVDHHRLEEVVRRHLDPAGLLTTIGLPQGSAAA